MCACWALPRSEGLPPGPSGCPATPDLDSAHCCAGCTSTAHWPVRWRAATSTGMPTGRCCRSTAAALCRPPPPSPSAPDSMTTRSATTTAGSPTWVSPACPADALVAGNHDDCTLSLDSILLRGTTQLSQHDALHGCVCTTQTLPVFVGRRASKRASAVGAAC